MGFTQVLRWFLGLLFSQTRACGDGIAEVLLLIFKVVYASGVITDPTFGAFIMLTKMMFCGDDEMCVIMGGGLMTFVVICKQR